MTLWLALVALAAIAAGLVALPFLRPRPADATPTDAVEIMKAELARVNLDHSVGELDDEAAAAARLEAERRLLAAAAEAPEPAPAPSMTVDRVAAAIVVGSVVLGAAVLYAAMGKPNVPGSPTVAAAAPTGDATENNTTPAAPGDVDAMIANLQARLQVSPGDAEGWRMLGWSFFATQRYPQAADAYARAVSLDPASASDQSAYGEALAQAAGGQVTPEARKAFETALKIDPEDQRAKAYLSPAAAAVAQPPRQASLAAPPAPGAAPVSADQQAMINGMVDRQARDLAANPRDAEGWVRLMRSRAVLGQPDLAHKALRDALAAFKDDPATQQQLRDAAQSLGVS